MTVKNNEKLEQSRVALTVEVGAEEFEAAVAKAYLKARGKLSIPGFRPGKAPRKMIEKRFGAQVFYSDAVDIALPDAYEAALAEAKLETVGYPEISLEGDVTADGFTFKAIVAVYPEVKLGQYKGIEAPQAEIKITADDVTMRLNEMAEKNSRLVSVDREAKLGDVAVIDFEGFDNGKAFEGGKGENYELELGSGSFVPGFESQVVGMKAGDEKEIDITFPKDYVEDLAGKPVVFKVAVKEVKAKELPELDDEFAKDVSEFDTLDELKADVEKKLADERETAAKYAFEDAVMDKVADGIEADIPQVMIDEQAQSLLDNFKQRIASQGIAYDQYVKATGMDEAKFLEEAKNPATRQVRLELALGAIVKEENLEVSDEEVEAEYSRMAEQYGMDAENIKKYLDAGTVRAQLIRNKAVAVVVDSAVRTAPEAPVEEKAE